MSGKINKSIVRMLLRQGIKAVGITGIDGGILKALRKKKLLIINEYGRKVMIEGGYTGKINTFLLIISRYINKQRISTKPFHLLH